MTLNKLKSIYLLCSCITIVVCLNWITSSINELQLHKELLWKSPQLGRKPGRLVYMLLWSGETHTPFIDLGSGQKSFTTRKCATTNCFVTTDRNFFGGGILNFDVIAFMGRDLHPDMLPTERAPHQIYIYFNMESSPNYPVSNSIFDGFFNWTSTYRLDSEIPIPYILIRDKKGNVIGPKKEMDWSAVLEDRGEFTDFELNNKTEAAAIFVSHCDTLSKREQVVKDLNKELRAYNLNVDIYGRCGPYKCPSDKRNVCDRMLESDYYFYLSFENSFDEDYVTEKLLNALQNNVVPIVYGGANYSRFLPPGSYLDAREHSPQSLAEIMVHLMRTPEEYKQYFKWKKYYSYHSPLNRENVCNICAGVNDPSLLMTTRVYDQFRSWWNHYSFCLWNICFLFKFW